MAVFGPQLIYTIIIFVILSKLGKFYSFGRYLLCHKLYRYLSPNSDDLKKAVRNHYKNANSKNKKLNRLFEIDDDKEEFNIPEGATIELGMSPVLPYDLYYIKYTDEFQSFVDISMIALLIYVTTEIYIAFFRPTDEINLSVVWCGMALLYGLSSLSTIAINYLRTDEASLLYIFAGLSFILSLIVQLADTRFFDFNLKEAFRNFSTNTLNLIQAHAEAVSLANRAYSTAGTESATDPKQTTTTTTTSQKFYTQLKTYSTNELLFSCTIGVLSGFIGALLFFPSFRLARLHFLCLKYNRESKLKRLLFYLNFIMPLLVSFCWFKTNLTFIDKSVEPSPSSLLKQDGTNTDDDDTAQQQFLSLILNTNSTLINQTNSTTLYIKELRTQTIKFFYNFLNSSNLKIYLIIFIFLLRILLYKHYAQSYLNLAFELASNLRKKSNKITNVQYMSTISSIYQYYGVVASQYVIPLFVLLFFVLLLKTLGDFTWCGNLDMCNQFVDSVANYTLSLRANSSLSSPNLLKQFETSSFNVTIGHNALNKIFTPFVLKSLLGYFTFWTATVWFTISSFGLLYYQYIDRQVYFD